MTCLVGVNWCPLIFQWAVWMLRSFRCSGEETVWQSKNLTEEGAVLISACSVCVHVSLAKGIYMCGISAPCCYLVFIAVLLASKVVCTYQLLDIWHNIFLHALKPILLVYLTPSMFHCYSYSSTVYNIILDFMSTIIFSKSYISRGFNQINNGHVNNAKLEFHAIRTQTTLSRLELWCLWLIPVELLTASNFGYRKYLW